MAEATVKYMDKNDVNYSNVKSHHIANKCELAYHIIKTESRTTYIPVTTNLRSVTVDTNIDKG